MLNHGNEIVGQISKLYNVHFKGFFQIMECFICTSVQLSKLIAES